MMIVTIWNVVAIANAFLLFFVLLGAEQDETNANDPAWIRRLRCASFVLAVLFLSFSVATSYWWQPCLQDTLVLIGAALILAVNKLALVVRTERGRLPSSKQARSI